ncbi:MAG: CBS domain-containing protein [Acidimicrobiia bacterium]
MQKTIEMIVGGKGSEVFSIGASDSVYKALETMADKNVGALVVLDEGRLVGILSERDYARKVILLSRMSKDTRVSEIMTSDPYTVSSSATVAECMQLMTDRRIRHLPVVDDDSLTGIISIGDVVRAVIEEQEFLIHQLESYITG